MSVISYYIEASVRCTFLLHGVEDIVFLYQTVNFCQPVQVVKHTGHLQVGGKGESHLVTSCL